jgi:cytochrome c553
MRRLERQSGVAFFPRRKRSLAPLALSCAAGLVAAAWLGGGAPAASGDQPSPSLAQAPAFDEHVRPILAAKCHRCHGRETQKSALDLSSPRSIRQGGESGPILDDQNPIESKLYEYVSGRVMPPEGEGELSDDEIATIRRWIEAGGQLPDEQADSSQQVTEHDALPILLLRCAICHGRQRRESGLDVRSVAALRAGGKSGPAIVPGKPDESLLVKRIRAAEMPPLKKLAPYSVKPVTADELATLTRWIAAGAPEAAIAPDVATSEPDPLVSDSDRQFWSFQPPRWAPPPAVDATDRVRNAIDAFVLAKLEERGLTLSPEAQRATLIRRVYIDLVGLPPEPDEVDAFIADTRADAYERLVDRALASHHYGERWGQYWLDLAGYCDSEGITNADDIRPHVWRYRDYVIRAHNDDKPYDRFLIEQLAGDELADYEHAAEITPAMYDGLVATAFLRLAPDGTYAPITSFVPDRLEVIDDEIEVFTSTVLGLTVKCARCHSHKFDPIPQRDYYRLAAVLKGALDEHDWLPPRLGGPHQPADANTCLVPYVTSAERAAWQAAGAKAENEPKIRAVWDHGEPSPTYILRRGNYLTRGKLVGPGVPSVLTDGRTPFHVAPPWTGSKKTGRRLALARWVTRMDHPLTARVMVNRMWKHHFGEGIVRSLDNFGKLGTPPTHPELLDYLAAYFSRGGWSVKSLHRLMMTSATYRQSSDVSEAHQRLDADNLLLSRMPLRRMEAEVLRDSMLAVAGRLDGTLFGPPDALEVGADGLVSARAGNHRRWRRSIYVLKRRTQPLTILQGFDMAGMDPNCIERRESIVAPQALHLANNALVRELATAFAERICKAVGDDPRAQVRSAYRIAMGRAAKPEEERVALAALAELESAWARNRSGEAPSGTASTPPAERGSPPDPSIAGRRALENLCHALFNSAAFLYID